MAESLMDFTLKTLGQGIDQIHRLPDWANDIAKLAIALELDLSDTSTAIESEVKEANVHYEKCAADLKKRREIDGIKRIPNHAPLNPNQQHDDTHLGTEKDLEKLKKEASDDLTKLRKEKTEVYASALKVEQAINATVSIVLREAVSSAMNQPEVKDHRIKQISVGIQAVVDYLNVDNQAMMQAIEEQIRDLGKDANPETMEDAIRVVEELNTLNAKASNLASVFKVNNVVTDYTLVEALKKAVINVEIKVIGADAEKKIREADRNTSWAVLAKGAIKAMKTVLQTKESKKPKGETSEEESKAFNARVDAEVEKHLSRVKNKEARDRRTQRGGSPPHSAFLGRQSYEPDRNGGGYLNDGICNDWKKYGICSRGRSCRFAHPTPIEDKKNFVKGKHNKERDGSTDTSPAGSRTGTPVPSNKKRERSPMSTPSSSKESSRSSSPASKGSVKKSSKSKN